MTTTCAKLEARRELGGAGLWLASHIYMNIVHVCMPPGDRRRASRNVHRSEAAFKWRSLERPAHVAVLAVSEGRASIDLYGVYYGLK